MPGRVSVDLLKKQVSSIIGESPFDIERILSQFSHLPYFYGYVAYSIASCVEMACWDLIGKACNQPIHNLIGGCYRDEVEYAMIMNPTGDFPTMQERIVNSAKNWVAQGFTTIKMKGAIEPPDVEVDTMYAVREAVGRDIKLRLDPNGGWSPQTALRTARKLLDVDLEYLEDPTLGLNAMAWLHKQVPIPFATNMCVVNLTHVPDAFRMGSVDVVLGDPNKFGGITALKKLYAMCDTLGWGSSMHCGFELGIGEACKLQVIASTPSCTYAIDTFYNTLGDDIIKGGKMQFVNGKLKVPKGPGLGVELDEDKVAEFRELYEKYGALDVHAQTNTEGVLGKPIDKFIF